ncbi:hypothetical protein CEH05_19865 [Halobacillus halophilus]|uniref:hypothetical protein n=1 Tax=Halobacillus halophilus TaxID=1570 RepID=UPI0005A1286C|nr:hypothetical protein [Halobacillus halophilus]ASF41298.1 hypothetical protein CEH05_19865 [Halobacillus halophilus]
MKKGIMIVILIASLTLVTACSGGETELDSDEKIEAFIANTLGNEEGAYKEVNSQIIMEGSGDTLEVEARKIEDYYSKQGDYIKTILTHSTTKEGDVTKELNDPLTSMIPEDFTFEEDTLFPVSSELSEEDKRQLKEHILNEFKEKF